MNFMGMPPGFQSFRTARSLWIRPENSGGADHGIRALEREADQYI